MTKNKSKPWYKSKYFLYSSAVVSLLAGGATGLSQTDFGAKIVQALTIPSSMQEIGKIGSAPVLKAPSNSLKDQWFSDLSQAIFDDKTPDFVVEQAHWIDGQTSLEGGQPLSTFGQTPAWVFGGDGYDSGDLGRVMNIGDEALIHNVGTALDVKGDKSVPISLKVKLLSADGFGAPGGGSPMALSSSLMMVKNQGSTITIGWGGELTQGGDGTGGNEGGSAGGGAADGSSMLYISKVRYAIQLINDETGQPLPDNTLMPIKVSDIDATQWANVGQEGAAAFVLGNNTNISLIDNHFQVNTDAAFEADSNKLSPTSVLALKYWNQNVITYSYNGLTDRNDIVTAIFGTIPWEPKLNGTFDLDKTTKQFGKDLPNGNYSFAPIEYKIYKKGDASKNPVAWIHLDKDGKPEEGKIKLRAGNYMLEEGTTASEGNFATTGQTKRPDIPFTIESGKTTTLKGADLENTAVEGTISIVKTLSGMNSLPSSNYTFEGIQFKIISEDGKYTDTVTLDKNGKATSKKLPLGKYTVQEVASSVKPEHGQTVNETEYNVEIKYKDENTEVVAATKDIANKPILGQITIDKSLAGYGKNMPNSNYSLAGLKFKLTNLETKKTYTVTTDKNGVAKTDDNLLLGEYEVQEIASSVTKPSGQTANTKVYKANLVAKGNTTQLVVADAKVDNKAVLGQITIKKTGLESGTDMWNNNYSLAGNVFEITPTDPSKTTWKDGKFPLQITTDKNGVAKTPDTLPLGKYKVTEVKASSGFANTFKPITAELTWKNNTTELVFDSVSGTNTEIKGQNTLEKSDKETGKEQNGKASMKTAQYELFYADDSTGSSAHKKDTPVKWADMPKAKLLKGDKVTQSQINGQTVKWGDAIVLDVDDKDLNISVGNLAIGKYYWKEINAPVGYVLDKEQHAFEITKKDDKTQNIVTPDTKSEEQVIKAKVTIQKLAEILGESAEAGRNGVEFTLTPINGTKGQAQTFKTGINEANNEDGYASIEFNYGDYVITETKGPEGFDKIRPIYIHMTTDSKKDIIAIGASSDEDTVKMDFETYQKAKGLFGYREYELTDNANNQNPNAGDQTVGSVSTDKPTISLPTLRFTDKVTPDPEIEPEKDVTKTDGGNSINHGDVALSSDFVYSLKSSEISNGRNKDIKNWSILDNYDERYDRFNGTYKVYALVDFKGYKKGDLLPKEWFTATDKDGKVNFEATQAMIDYINTNKNSTFAFEIRADFYRHTPSDVVYNYFDETRDDRKERSNEVDTKTNSPQPHKFDVTKPQADLTGDKLLDDDREMSDRYQDTNENPYNDKKDNNESFNNNTNKVKAGDVINYQLWLDTRPYDATSELTVLEMVDDYDEKFSTLDTKSIHVYDAKGKDVTANFKVTDKDGKVTIAANKFKQATNSKGEKVQIVDTKAIPLGQTYKIELQVKVKKDTPAGTDIINSAKQITHDSLGKVLDQITEKRVNPTEGDKPKPSKDVIKTDDGKSINHGNVALDSDFIYVLNSSGILANRVQDMKNWSIVDNYDEKHDQFNGDFKVLATSDFADYKKGQVLPQNFFTAKDDGKEVTFEATDKFLELVNKHKDQAINFSIHASFYRFDDSDKVVNTFTEVQNDDKQKSNEVDTKTKEPQPHKFDLSKPQVDLTGNKLLDDDKEIKDRYADTNKDPHVDKTDNNEKENLNTKTVKVGDKITYQLWLDTTPFDNTSELTYLSMADTFDKQLDVKSDSVKVYDAKGKDVTANFQVTLKDNHLDVSANKFTEATNSKGDKVKVIDTKSIPFGVTYKIEFTGVVKSDTKDGYELVNTAEQAWTDSNGIDKKHVTEKRVNPVKNPPKPSAPEKPKTPQTPQTPPSAPNKPKDIINILLPKAGEQRTALAVLGSALMALIVFLKRNALLKAYRKFVRSLGK